MTGSAYIVQTKHARVTVDCGMFQGGRKSEVAPSRPRVMLTHGEDGPRTTLAGMIQKRFNLKASLPRMGEAIEM